MSAHRRFTRLPVLLGIVLAVLAGLVALWPAVAGAAPSPAAPSTSAPSPAAASSPTAAAQPGKLTVTYDDDCGNYGADVTNHDTIAHTVTLVDGGTAGSPVVIPPGETRHLSFDGTDAGDSIQIVDSVDGVIVDTAVRFCVGTDNRSVTIKANRSYTLTGGSPAIADPKPQHGTVTFHVTSIRYTPDPCFSGTDRFGYDDSIYAEKGVVTVHVRPGSCGVKVRRSATDCGHRSVSYTAANPYSLPARIEVEGKAGATTLTVPAHTTKVVRHEPLDPKGAPTETVTFRLAETGHTLLTDRVHFPCPLPVSHEGQSPATGPPGLAATGTSVAEPAAFGGAALVVLGAGLLLAGRYRRTDG